MPLTVRLDPATRRLLEALARRGSTSRSNIVREALSRYGAQAQIDESAGRPFEAWSDVIGVVKLGVRDPGRTTGDQFADTIRRRVRARRPR